MDLSDNSRKTVLITGATGRQGGAVLSHMLPKGWKLRALTRNTESHASKSLAAKGVEMVAGDLEDPASLERAVRGVYGVYSVQDFWAVGSRREVMQGKNLAEAASKARVEHFVYSSVGGAERNSGIDQWDGKYEIEKHIRKLGLPATVLRPASFFEDYYFQPVEIALFKGKLMDPIRAEKPYQMIAIHDIGAFAALAFERPKDMIGLELEIAGSELKNPEAAKIFSRVLNRPVRFQRIPLPLFRLILGKEFYLMFSWMDKYGYQANIPELRRKYPEVHLHSLEEWLYMEGWHKHARRVKPPKE
jgi:uncharacterized protein YbjT (DUF2867 family)